MLCVYDSNNLHVKLVVGHALRLLLVGCGKSTQVPQYLLEEATEEGRGGACSVIITQPRRIAAVGLASRVAAERGERLGDVVGYSVRLDSKQSARTRLLFCTTGGCTYCLKDNETLRVTQLVSLYACPQQS